MATEPSVKQLNFLHIGGNLHGEWREYDADIERVVDYSDPTDDSEAYQSAVLWLDEYDEDGDFIGYRPVPVMLHISLQSEIREHIPLKEANEPN